MGIREEREAQAARFVNMHDLLDGLAEAEAITIKEVAGYLLQKLATNDAPRFIRQDSQSLTCFKADAKQADNLLRHVACTGKYPDGFGFEELSPEEYNSNGWFRTEIAAFLKGLNIDAPSCCNPLWKPKPKRPYWYSAYENRIRISLGEAVSLLNGIDPEDGQPFDIDDHQGYAADLRRWEEALIDAINSGPWEFDPSTWGMYQSEQTVLHYGIKEWAKDTGAPWPFIDDSRCAQDSIKNHATDKELREAKERIAELEQELQEKRQADVDTPDYLDPGNPRYAPKLAALVRAWLAVQKAAPGKTVKQTLEKWLSEHAVELGLTDEDGNPQKLITGLAAIPNWDTTGGPPPTPGN